MIIYIIFIIGALIGPALILIIIGSVEKKYRPQRAKLFYILAAVYVLISGGICASLVM